MTERIEKLLVECKTIDEANIFEQENAKYYALNDSLSNKVPGFVFKRRTHPLK